MRFILMLLFILPSICNGAPVCSELFHETPILSPAMLALKAKLHARWFGLDANAIGALEALKTKMDSILQGVEIQTLQMKDKAQYERYTHSQHYELMIYRQILDRVVNTQMRLDKMIKAKMGRPEEVTALTMDASRIIDFPTRVPNFIREHAESEENLVIEWARKMAEDLNIEKDYSSHYSFSKPFKYEYALKFTYGHFSLREGILSRNGGYAYIGVSTNPKNPDEGFFRNSEGFERHDFDHLRNMMSDDLGYMTQLNIQTREDFLEFQHQSQELTKKMLERLDRSNDQELVRAVEVILFEKMHEENWSYPYRFRGLRTSYSRELSQTLSVLQRGYIDSEVSMIIKKRPDLAKKVLEWLMVQSESDYKILAERFSISSDISH
jgi:hypothetical protein